MAMTLGLYPKSEFLNKYIHFYKDFLELDKILPINAKILPVGGIRVSAYYSPRSIYMSVPDFEISKGPGYLFVDGEDHKSYFESLFGLQIGKKIYENNNSVQYTFRTPGKLPLITHLRVFDIIDNPNK